MYKPRVIYALLALVSSPFFVQAETATHSVPEVNWEPFWMIEENRSHGIFGDLMTFIRTQGSFSLGASDPLPVKRVQLMFARGEIQIECCINKSWRPERDQQGRTLWTEPVMTTYEVLAFPAGQEFEAASTADLAGKQVATILGYGYANDALFARNDVLNNIAQLKLVAFGRVAAGIFDENELRYILNKVPEAKALADEISLGPRIGSSKLRMRVHSSREDLLEPLNRLIEQVRRDGTLETIRARYLGD